MNRIDAPVQVMVAVWC